jgi:hypothetical protein
MTEMRMYELECLRWPLHFKDDFRSRLHVYISSGPVLWSMLPMLILYIFCT